MSSLRRLSSCCCSLRSSAATRAWTWSSASWARDASVCRFLGGQYWTVRYTTTKEGRRRGLCILCSGASGLRTSVLDCSDSTISCDTLLGDDLEIPPIVSNRATNGLGK